MLNLVSRIQTASRCYKETIAIERDLLRDGVYKLKDMQALINKPVRASMSCGGELLTREF